MHAKRGDWLVVEQTLVFPGPDPHVVTRDELAGAAARAAESEREIVVRWRRS